MSITQSGPLAGLRVLELSRVLAGPWACQALADLGADVVKVERTGIGDDTRRWGPPYISGSDSGHNTAAYYYAANRGKRSIAVDFSTDTGREQVCQLVSHADIVVENFKVGGLKKFGLDSETMRKRFPRLIYCSISGFGQTGPKAHLPGYDFIIQAMSGAMSITGFPEAQPVKAGYATADITCGLYVTIAILAALQKRHQTGSGATIDISLLESQMAVLGIPALNYMLTQESPARIGNCHASIAPYDVFQAQDGLLVIAAGNNKQFEALCRALDLQHLLDDKRFCSNRDRVINRQLLNEFLSANLRKKSRETILSCLEHYGVPSGPVNTIDEALADPQLLARNIAKSIPCSESDAKIIVIGSPIVIDGQRQTATRFPPSLGQDNHDVIRDKNWSGT